MVNIVVVDDEERIRQGLAKLITQAGERFLVTGVYASGFELLEQLDQRMVQADLVITDIKMPVMNGLDLIERLRERVPQTRIAIVSGFDDFTFARQALRFGVEEYLLKPVDKGELEQLLRKVDESLTQEREKEHALRDDQLGLLLFNEAELLPKQLRQEAGKALELSPLFSNPYAVYIIRGKVPGSLESMLETAAAGWLHNWKLVAGDDSYALIVGMNSADHAERAREIGQTLLHRLPPSFEGRIGGSDVFRGASWLREAYRQAELAIQHAWYDTGRRVFADYTRLPRRQHSVKHLLVLLDREFQETMTLSDFARAQESIARWFATCKEDALPWVELREGCETVLAFIHRYGSAKKCETAKQPRSKACLPHKFPDFGAYATFFLGEVEEQFRALQESRQENRVIETVKAYIVQHYTEELELNRLAEEVYLTPSYLSKLFKTETGETITDFLISVRIDRAKDMLRDRSALKTYEIGEKVGYVDPAYFNKVFKKVVGCTPKEYRDRVR